MVYVLTKSELFLVLLIVSFLTISFQIYTSSIAQNTNCVYKCFNFTSLVRSGSLGPTLGQLYSRPWDDSWPVSEEEEEATIKSRYYNGLH